MSSFGEVPNPTPLSACLTSFKLNHITNAKPTRPFPYLSRQTTTKEGVHAQESLSDEVSIKSHNFHFPLPTYKTHLHYKFS